MIPTINFKLLRNDQMKNGNIYHFIFNQTFGRPVDSNIHNNLCKWESRVKSKYPGQYNLSLTVDSNNDLIIDFSFDNPEDEVMFHLKYD